MKYIFLLVALSISCTHAAEKKYNAVGWERVPQVQFNRTIYGKRLKVFKGEIKIKTDAQGNVEFAEITKSTGNKKADIAVRYATFHAKMKPYYENGVAMPIIAVQPFEFENPYYEEGTYYQCKWEVESAHFTAQEKYKTFDDAFNEMDFVYLKEPSNIREYESTDNTNQIMGKYNVKFSSKEGKIESYAQVIDPPNLYGYFAIDAIKSTEVRSKKKIWLSDFINHQDQITIFKKCESDPII